MFVVNNKGVIYMEENKNIDNQISQTEVADYNKEDKRKKKKTGKIIANILTFIIFTVIILEGAIGIINMQRISNKEEPIWYLNTKTTETELKTVTEYNLGLYRIVKTDTAKETKITLKPFFIAD